MTPQTPDLHALVERLEKLESRNGTLRVGAVVLVVFAVAILPTGQARPAGSNPQNKFARYRQPAAITALEWNLLKAEVAAHEVRLREENQGIVGVPTFDYDQGLDRIVATTYVSPGFMERTSLDQVRKRLERGALFAIAMVGTAFPKGVIQISDIVVDFRSFDAHTNFYSVATYRDGQLRVH